jgi:hypothetical protein
MTELLARVFHDPELERMALAARATNAEMRTAAPANPGIAAGNAQPQTTVEPAGGPFIRHSQPGARTQFSVSGYAFGGVINQPLVAAPGYARKYRLAFTASGGVNGTVTVAATSDAPFSLVQSILVRDAYGTQLFNGTGYEILYLVPKYGGGFGLFANSDIKSLPSYSAISTGSSGTGNFTFSTAIGLEFAMGYGVISVANSSLLPSIQINLATATQVYSTAPGTLPTIGLVCDLDYWWLPEGSNVPPPGLGTTQQWNSQPCNPNIGSGGSLKVQLPRLGGYLSVLIFELRDANGVRQDYYPARVRFYLDGVPILDQLLSEIYDDMAIAFQNTRDTGIIAYTRKTSLGQAVFGLLDDQETLLSTNPGTQIELGDGPWGSGSGPFTLTVLAGQIVPSGAILQGLPSV